MGKTNKNLHRQKRRKNSQHIPIITKNPKLHEIITCEQAIKTEISTHVLYLEL